MPAGRYLGARGGDLGLHRVGPGKRPVRFPVPVPGIVEIALESVDDAVKPSGEGGLFRLDDGVRLLPVAGGEVVDRARETRLRHGSDDTASRTPGAIAILEGIGEDRPVTKGDRW